VAPNDRGSLTVENLADGDMTDRPPKVPTEEIEITPEMIEAGEDIILVELGGDLPHSYPSARALAEAVYRAMALADSKSRGLDDAQSA
jgi:hypothetical protein